MLVLTVIVGAKSLPRLRVLLMLIFPVILEHNQVDLLVDNIYSLRQPKTRRGDFFPLITNVASI